MSGLTNVERQELREAIRGYVDRRTAEERSETTELAQRMREAAEKATPGPWGIARDGMTVTSNQSHPIATLSEASHRMLSDGSTGQDAEFIALANPVNVLTLLDRIAELEELATDYGMKFQRAQDALKHVSLMHRGETRTEQQPVAYTDMEELKFPHATSDMWPAPLGFGRDIPLYINPPVDWDNGKGS
ncbi:hypothetical protein STW0522KLE44_42120 [Klebsiella sp. STW0522-44]|nr:hypothetical protein STW0522KLE44_42120 [Klebsiella sp. STW0522-44]